MSKYSIDSTTLTSIADAIRLKDGSSSPIVVNDFASKIREIPTSASTVESPNFTYPYNIKTRIGADTIKLVMPEDYIELAQIPIPYSVWSQYKSITFNYVISNGRRASYGLNGSYAKIEYALAYIDSNNIWSSSIESIYPSSSSRTNILLDFSGSVSDTYTINCENFSPITESNRTYDAIVIRLFVKAYQKSDTSSEINFNLGNFTGVKK